MRYLSRAEVDNLYRITSVSNNQFAILKTEPDEKGFVSSYHPSYTFKYGNTTSLGDLA